MSTIKSSITVTAAAIIGLAVSLPGIAQQGTPSPDEVIKQQFQSMDRNGDGRIAREDVTPGTALYKHFDRYDTGDTGYIDLDEFRAYVQERRMAQQRRES